MVSKENNAREHNWQARAKTPKYNCTNVFLDFLKLVTDLDILETHTHS